MPDNTHAKRQARYRAKVDVSKEKMGRLIAELMQACDRGRCSHFLDNLPDEPAAMYEEIAARLMMSCLIVTKHDPEKVESVFAETVEVDGKLWAGGNENTRPTRRERRLAQRARLLERVRGMSAETRKLMKAEINRLEKEVAA